MKLYTINATPVQSFEQMKSAGYVIDEGDVARINGLHLEEYPQTVARTLKEWNIDGFTIYQVQGYWMGTPEVSFKIEIALSGTETYVDGDDETASRMARKISEKLASIYNQDAVMLTLPDNTVEFIERDDA